VVDRRFVLEQAEREKFRAFMRMQEHTISQTICKNSPCHRGWPG
jgi:hypothetical protein